jgi:hypothetical protein
MEHIFEGQSVLTPMLALIGWSLVVWVWMLATRIPTMAKLKIHPQKAVHPAEMTILPSEVRRVSDNYNHLMEQPTLFYALAVYTYLAAHQSPFAVALAWTYVALRIVHSLVQIIVNKVIWRFYLFVASTLVLVVWAARDVMVVLQQ